MRTRTFAVSLCIVGALTACINDKDVIGIGDDSPSIAVAVMDNAFDPATLEVDAGETVTWQWKGSNPHNVTFQDDVTSETQSAGSFARTFSEPGTYEYFCTVHGEVMSGTVIVK